MVLGSDVRRHGVVLFAAVTVSNVSAAAFHVVMTRLLPPGEYGALGAFLAAFTLVSIAATGVQPVVAKRAAQLRARSLEGELARFVSWTLRVLAIFSLLATLLLVPVAPLASRFLHFDSHSTGILLVLVVVVNFAIPVARGGLQGLMNFAPIARSVVVGAACRLVVGVALVRLGWGIDGAAIAYLVDAVVELVLTVVPLWRFVSFARSARSTAAGLWREIGRATLAVGGLSVLSGVNLVLVRHYFPGVASGFYAAAWTLASVVLYLPIAVTLAAFPRFAESAGRGLKARQELVSSILIAGVIGFAAVGFVALAGPSLTRFIFGSPYERVGGVATVLTLAMAFHGMTRILTFFHLASGSAVVFAVAPAIALETTAIAVFHASIGQVASIVLSTEVVLFALYSFLAAHSALRKGDVQQVSSWAV